MNTIAFHPALGEETRLRNAALTRQTASILDLMLSRTKALQKT
jgi:hypothetical protein